MLPKVCYLLPDNNIDKEFDLSELAIQQGSNEIPLEQIIQNKSHDCVQIFLYYGSYDLILWKKPA